MFITNIRKILPIILFGEASVCPDDEKRKIAGVFMNMLNYPIHFFDNDGDDDKDGLPDPDDVAKNFHAWTKPNIHLTNNYDLKKFGTCIEISEEYITKYLEGQRVFDDGIVFYITKKRLQELTEKGKNVNDIFTKYYEIVEVDMPANFLHRFFKIVGTRKNISK
jgi:hypothetical protein